MRIGSGASDQLPSVMGTLGLARPLIVTDSYLVQTGRVQRLTRALGGVGISSRVFSETVPDPTVTSIDAGVAALKAGDHDCVIGFGGGSPIDSAKAIAVLGIHGGLMRDYKVPHHQDQAGLPIIAIPTTAGTGAEATRFTIVTESASNEKMLCMGLAYLPVAALVDFELTLTKPPRLTADTGIDALTHAIEAYVSRLANPFSDGLAISAMRAIAPNLRRVWADPTCRPAREAMMIGATQAGIAFSNSSVALVHGMSRPIGAHFHVAHGLSNAMLLPTVTAFSLPAATHRYANCARAMGLVEGGRSDADASVALIEELRLLNAELQVPTPQAYGIDLAQWRDALDVMAEQALSSGSPANNPRIPTHDEIKQLYEQAWNA
jgi:alcohol dehydrogenase class IV